MLPLTLICLLQAQLAFSQSSVQLSLNSLYSSKSSSRSVPTLFSLPGSKSNVSVSVALCSATTSAPRFFLSNDTSISQPGPEDVGEDGVFEIALEDGWGEWTGSLTEGGVLAVSNSGSAQTPFEIGVSDDGTYTCLSPTCGLTRA
jgi:calcium channel MID1